MLRAEGANALCSDSLTSNLRALMPPLLMTLSSQNRATLPDGKRGRLINLPYYGLASSPAAAIVVDHEKNAPAPASRRSATAGMRSAMPRHCAVMRRKVRFAQHRTTL